MGSLLLLLQHALVRMASLFQRGTNNKANIHILSSLRLSRTLAERSLSLFTSSALAHAQAQHTIDNSAIISLTSLLSDSSSSSSSSSSLSSSWATASLLSKEGNHFLRRQRDRMDILRERLGALVWTETYRTLCCGQGMSDEEEVVGGEEEQGVRERQEFFTMMKEEAEHLLLFPAGLLSSPRRRRRWASSSSLGTSTTTANNVSSPSSSSSSTSPL